MKYFIGGVNGAGKTTLLHEIKKNLPQFEIVKASQAFMDFLGISGDYEALRAFSHEEALKKLEDMMSVLIERHDNMIVDSHYLNLVRGKTKSVTGNWIKNFDAIVLLNIDPKTALYRIEKDEARDRALFPAGLAKEEQERMYADYVKEYRQSFESLVKKWQIPSIVLDGAQKPAKIAETFIAFDNKLRSMKN